jgi:N-acetyl sugar amidotransferase
MDTTDPQIVFDDDGVCNHCLRAERLLPKYVLSESESQKRLASLATQIRESAPASRYNCILGMSGGIDSSYVAYLAGELKLNPLVVHLDNGWNSEIAVSNIKKIVGKLGFHLHTEVIDWEEFRDIQRAFFMASVIDIEMVSDHAIFASMYKLARKYRIKYVLSGTNFRTEHTMPSAWYWRKQDLVNLKAIHNAFGKIPMRTFPTLTSWRFQASRKLGYGQRFVELLNNINYTREMAKKTLEQEFDWRYYGGKHFESIFTKFYQAYLLPHKFGVDKRKAHLSDLIHNNEMTREEAIVELQEPIYNPAELKSDIEYVKKKLGFSDSEFSRILEDRPRPHLDFKSDQKLVDLMHWVNRKVFSPQQ